VTPASEQSRTGLATVRSPLLPDPAPKAALAFLTSGKWAQAVDQTGLTSSSLRVGSPYVAFAISLTWSFTSRLELPWAASGKERKPSHDLPTSDRSTSV
jgi:hypothetical protein